MKCGQTIFLLLFVLNIAAQQSPTDSAWYAQSVNNAVQLYRKEVKENLHIFNGAEYLRTSHGVKGTPFFVADSLLPGAVFYDGRLYENVPLHYDMVTDNVVISNYAQNNELVLVPEKLNYFYAAEHLFIRLTADSALPSFIQTGFYEKLYDGKMMVLARRQKIPRQAGVASDTELRYNEYNYYFVFLDNTFYKVSDKSDFLALAGDKKEEIRKFIKTNQLKFNKKREAAMVAIAAYYSQLKN